MTSTTFLTQLEDHERILLVPHRHADRDAVGSAIGLTETLDATTAICLPDGATAGAQPLLADCELIADPDLAAYDVVVVIDAPSLDRIRPIDPTTIDTVCYLIDHHAPDDLETVATSSLVDTDAESTAELVHRAIDGDDRNPSPTAATALVAGLLADTGGLATAGPSQISQLTSLLTHARGNENSLASLYPPPQPDGDRMAQFKGAVRADGYQAGDVVIAFTRIGGNESDAARALLEVGADCAFALSDQGNHIRVVGRCTDGFADQLSLGSELFPALADHGGGHDAAGTVRLSGEAVPDAKAAILEAVERQLGTTFGPVS